MYNFLSALIICGALVIIGEFVSRLTKTWLPSVFVTAVLILIGYWTVLPKTLVTDAYLLPLGATVSIFMIVTHMGTMISIEELLAQWKTVAICLMGLVGMTIFAWFLCPLFMDRVMVIAGLPPLAGGIVAATMMQDAAAKAGYVTASVFAISMYCIQGFAGYPLTAVALKKESAKLLALYRSGAVKVDRAEEEAEIAEATKGPERRQGILSTPESWNTPIFLFLKVAVGAWIAFMLGKYTGISGAIWALIVGVVLCRVGFLEPKALNRTNTLEFLMFALMMWIFDGLKDCTPQMVTEIWVPIVALIFFGVLGLAVFSMATAKILGVSPWLGFSNALTALYGFPFNAIITEQLCHSEAKTKDEEEYLMSQIFPSMIIGGFVTVTITSVIMAGIFSKLF